MSRFTARYRRAEVINGERGYDFWIYERLASPGVDVLVRCGWTAGKRRDAEQEVARAIREIEAKEAA